MIRWLMCVMALGAVPPHIHLTPAVSWVVPMARPSRNSRRLPESMWNFHREIRRDILPGIVSYILQSESILDVEFSDAVHGPVLRRLHGITSYVADELVMHPKWRWRFLQNEEMKMWTWATENLIYAAMANYATWDSEQMEKYLRNTAPFVHAFMHAMFRLRGKGYFDTSEYHNYWLAIIQFPPQYVPDPTWYLRIMYPLMPLFGWIEFPVWVSDDSNEIYNTIRQVFPEITDPESVLQSSPLEIWTQIDDVFRREMTSKSEVQLLLLLSLIPVDVPTNRVQDEVCRRETGWIGNVLTLSGGPTVINDTIHQQLEALLVRHCREWLPVRTRAWMVKVLPRYDTEISEIELQNSHESVFAVFGRLSKIDFASALHIKWMHSEGGLPAVDFSILFYDTLENSPDLFLTEWSRHGRIISIRTHQGKDYSVAERSKLRVVGRLVALALREGNPDNILSDYLKYTDPNASVGDFIFFGDNASVRAGVYDVYAENAFEYNFRNAKEVSEFLRITSETFPYRKMVYFDEDDDEDEEDSEEDYGISLDWLSDW